MHKNIYGFDVGGVILDDAGDGTDTSFLGDGFLKAGTMPGAIETLRMIRDFAMDRARRRAEADGLPFDENDPPIHIVSKCGETVERKTRLWMEQHDFYARTGIPEDHVHFCRERREKAPVCEALDVTYFVDDKLEALTHLDSVPNRYLFRGSVREIQRHREHLPRITPVESWADLANALFKPES